jgi:acyl-CoA synthetase (AMP-forming)/AMP-acid ligase II
MLEAGSLWELIEGRAQATPHTQMAVDEDKRTVTFAEYRDASERAAAGLAALGVGEGTPVSWQLPTWIESLVLVGGLARLGAVQNPMLPIYREREVRFITAQTGARLLVVPGVWRGFDFAAMASAVAAGADHLDVLVVDRVLPDGDPESMAPFAAPTREAPVRWVFYTSGTTADPKGAQHTDQTVMASARGMSLAFDLGPDDRAGLVFPFTHIGGIGWLFATLLTGCRDILVEAFDPSSTVDVLAREDVTLAGAGTPFHLAYLNEQRKRGGGPLFASVRAFPGGGAPKPPQLHYDIKSEIGGVGIVSGYGLTEAPILTMATIRDTDEQLAQTEGGPTPGVTLRVVKLDESHAGPGEEGEIRARGPQVFKGYLDSSLDADAFDDDGWFRTGDLGHLTPEGHVVITGRLKDIIIRKGENISAKELEDLLYTHPKVADVAVIGLPDPVLGERCCAVIAPSDASDPITFGEMVEFLKGQGMMAQKLPEQLELVDAVPRNPAGKILKHELRARYASK